MELLWLVACTPASSIVLGGGGDSADGAGGPGVLVGDTAAEVLPADSTPDTGDPPDPEDPPLYMADAIWEFTLDIDDDAWRSLSNDGNTYAAATLGWDGRTWPVMIHIKGSSSWQSIDDKPSLVVDVNREDPDQEFLGAKKFYLHNDCYDPSQMSETLSYRFYREAGYPASETSFARLEVNGRDYGLYTVTEPHNDDFLEKWFADPNGNLYENRDAYCDLEDLRCMDVQETDEGNDDAFLALGAAAKKSGAEWRPAVEPLLDWDRFIAYLALEITIVHWDSYSYDQSNYSFYHDPTANQWAALTQSMDLDYGFRPWSYPSCGQYGMSIEKYNMGMLAKSCQDDASCQAELLAKLSEYADFLEAADGAARVRELDSLIGDAVKSDPRRYYDDGDYDTHIECLQQFFADRPAQLRAWVAAQGG